MLGASVFGLIDKLTSRFLSPLRVTRWHLKDISLSLSNCRLYSKVIAVMSLDICRVYSEPLQ